ncbi:hypothetical protein MBRA1_000101 [Malassezia brasiliensis]|uniref:Uncharacterized protein n=1 Tax=Malassezia brasiliensis TaxID=1821822 RepID=A0AAF0IN88_9BASI|nr:hypothetical protein MBRA1_000101 [Malassezia brasiliensis]
MHDASLAWAAVRAAGLSTASIESLADAAIEAARCVPATDIATHALPTDAMLAPGISSVRCAPTATADARAFLADVAADTRIESVVTHVLQTYLRPLFARAAQHSRVQASGRAAHGARPLVWEDERPVWDDGSGAPNVLAWCVHALAHGAPEAWERVWPLVVPPIMVLLDAPGAYPKLLGACVAGEMLLPEAHACVPAELLRRTGLAELLDDALHSAMHHLSDAEVGAVLLSATLQTRYGLVRALYPAVDATSEAFEAYMRLFSDGILAALSYCAPPSASAPALRAPPGTALGSARLQHSLAGVACAWFWNAFLDWAAGWIAHAFEATTSMDTAPQRSMTSVVNEITQQDTVGDEKPVSGVAHDWAEAAHVLLASVLQTLHAVQAMVALAAEVDAAPPAPPALAIPTQLPGLHTYANEVVCASAQCYVSLTSLDVRDDGDALDEISGILQELRTLCATLHTLDPALDETWDALHRWAAVRPLVAT